MTRTHTAPRSVAPNTTRRSTHGRIGAAALALFGFALGACDSDSVTGPRAGESTQLPHQPTPVECAGAAIDCPENLF